MCGFFRKLVSVLGRIKSIGCGFYVMIKGNSVVDLLKWNNSSSYLMGMLLYYVRYLMKRV